MTMQDRISIKDILDYEIRSSWWARDISNPMLQELSARYFAWKTRRKYSRYIMSINGEEFVKAARTKS